MKKTIQAISISDRKGVRKKNRQAAVLLENFGLQEDAHGGKWHRQVSFLAQESINSMREKGLNVVAGNFAENITTSGIDLVALRVGMHLQVGAAEIVISQLGKICHHRCAIYHQAGDCVMPREGVFGVVRKGGLIKVGDTIEVLNSRSPSAAIIASERDEERYGQVIREKLNEKRFPAFIRFDSLSSGQSTFDSILKDLTDTQYIDDIIVFDPSGSCELTLAGYNTSEGKPGPYTRNSSTIYSFKAIEEIQQRGYFI